MEAEDIIIGGAILLGIGVVLWNRQQSDSNFNGFMDSIGGADVPDLVPVNGTSVQGKASTLASISDWAKAMFSFECGPLTATCRATRNNNPGNEKFIGQAGATSDASGFAVFPTSDAGFAYLQDKLTRWKNESPSMTLTQFYAKYMGQTDWMHPKVTEQGDPFSYAKAVAGKLGVSPDAPIGTIFGGG